MGIFWFLAGMTIALLGIYTFLKVDEWRNPKSYRIYQALYRRNAELREALTIALDHWLNNLQLRDEETFRKCKEALKGEGEK